MKRAVYFGLILLLFALAVAVFVNCGALSQSKLAEAARQTDDDAADDDAADDDAADDDAADDDAADDDAADDDAAFMCQGEPAPHKIVYTLWSSLGALDKAFFKKTFGSDAAAEDFYGRFVYWFSLTRELIRSSIYYYAAENTRPANRWLEEGVVADMAAKYFVARVDNVNLGILLNGVDQLLGALQSPVPAGNDPQDYFLANQAQILKNPAALLWYQATLAQYALLGLTPNNFGALLNENICHNVNGSIALTPEPPFTNYDQTLPPLLFTAFNTDLATWSLKLNPQLKLLATGTSASADLCQYE